MSSPLQRCFCPKSPLMHSCRLLKWKMGRKKGVNLPKAKKFPRFSIKPSMTDEYISLHPPPPPQKIKQKKTYPIISYLAKSTAASQSLVCTFFPNRKTTEINRVHHSTGNIGEALPRVIQSAHSEAETETDDGKKREAKK